DQAGGTHFLVMEYVAGTDLGRVLRERGRLPVAQACDYARQAALGLQHAFERGMVHRDIKPSNLMLTPGGQIKVLDFGLARCLSEALPPGGATGPDLPAPAREAPAAAAERAEAAPTGPLRPDSLPATEHVTGDWGGLGTADYMAPEVVWDAPKADIRADVYSLGCTLYQLLAGQVPFPEGGVAQKVRAHLDRLPRPVEVLRPDVPPEVARV